MSDFVRSSRPITLRARRDTIALIALALGLTGALASAIHSHRTAAGEAASGWTGELSEIPAESVPASKPAITSASLVVAPADLALPKVATPSAHARAKACEGINCPNRVAASLSAPRHVAALDTADPPARRLISDEAVEFVPRPPADVGTTRPGVIARLNPLRHLPDLSLVRRPLTAANDTISGWFRRF